MFTSVLTMVSNKCKFFRIIPFSPNVALGYLNFVTASPIPYSTISSHLFSLIEHVSFSAKMTHSLASYQKKTLKL